MNIYCCTCSEEVECDLVKGVELYPHRPDLHALPFWMCPTCGCYVGCHHKTKDRTRPLGVIPSNEIKNARSHIHKLLDPLWESGKIGRKELYEMLSDSLGYTYHTAELRAIEECRKVYRLVLSIKRGLDE